MHALPRLEWTDAALAACHAVLLSARLAPVAPTRSGFGMSRRMSDRSRMEPLRNPGQPLRIAHRARFAPTSWLHPGYG